MSWSPATLVSHVPTATSPYGSTWPSTCSYHTDLTLDGDSLFADTYCGKRVALQEHDLARKHILPQTPLNLQQVSMSMGFIGCGEVNLGRLELLLAVAKISQIRRLRDEAMTGFISQVLLSNAGYSAQFTSGCRRLQHTGAPALVLLPFPACLSTVECGEGVILHRSGICPTGQSVD
jgi:hypothetical protein